jgi:BlaI family transcriptional regulator, penicillinase repressor
MAPMTTRDSLPETTPPSVSNAEWEIMKVLWDHGPLAARDVYASLPENHGWAYKTAKTLLSRLVAKGAITYEQIGNSYLYKAALARSQVTRHEVRTFVDRVLDGSLAPLLAHFVNERELSDAEIADLKKLLDSRGKKGKSR